MGGPVAQHEAKQVHIIAAHLPESLIKSCPITVRVRFYEGGGLLLLETCICSGLFFSGGLEGFLLFFLLFFNFALKCFSNFMAFVAMQECALSKRRSCDHEFPLRHRKFSPDSEMETSVLPYQGDYFFVPFYFIPYVVVVFRFCDTPK